MQLAGALTLQAPFLAVAPFSAKFLFTHQLVGQFSAFLPRSLQPHPDPTFFLQGTTNRAEEARVSEEDWSICSFSSSATLSTPQSVLLHLVLKPLPTKKPFSFHATTAILFHRAHTKVIGAPPSHPDNHGWLHNVRHPPSATALPHWTCKIQIPSHPLSFPTAPLLRGSAKRSNQPDQSGQWHTCTLQQRQKDLCDLSCFPWKASGGASDRSLLHSVSQFLSRRSADASTPLSPPSLSLLLLHPHPFHPLAQLVIKSSSHLLPPCPAPGGRWESRRRGPGRTNDSTPAGFDTFVRSLARHMPVLLDQVWAFRSGHVGAVLVGLPSELLQTLSDIGPPVLVKINTLPHFPCSFSRDR